MNGDLDGSWLWEASLGDGPLPPPIQPLPSRQWQPTHQLTYRHSRASRVSHPVSRHRPFTRGLDAREMNVDLDGSWLWEVAVWKLWEAELA